MSAAARLLIVDDEVAQMRALRDTLSADGYATAGFASAREALDHLRECPADLLLTDLKMPEMDGIALLRAAREIDSNLVGIVMTGHATIDTAVQAMQAGAFDYIVKPFRLNVIRPVLRRALDLRRLQMENEALQKRVQEHALELEEANRKLQAANAELAAFSDSVSHDLRAPLRTIDGFSLVLEEDHGPGLDDDARRCIRLIREGAQRMDRMITDLLAFSRLGKQALCIDVYDARAAVERAVEEVLRNHAGERPEVIIEDLPGAHADVSLMHHVWVNLVSNAVKYSSRNPAPRIEIGGRLEDHEAVYHVRDNGAGFDMRFAGKLFGVFQRLHGMDDFPGTGVGLAIVHRIVTRHGGRVWAEGAVGKGATFHFTLPIGNQGEPTP